LQRQVQRCSAPRSAAVRAMPKSKEPPPPPPPPRPDPAKLQVRCIAWKSMDFQIDARLSEYQILHLEQIINARHGDPIDNLTLYKGTPGAATKLPTASTDSIGSLGVTTIFYDYYPPLDPFDNRPTGGEVAMKNPVITLQTFENLDAPLIEAEQLKWSETAKHDPFTAKRLAAEAAAAEAEAKAKAEEEARIKAEEEGQLQAERDARKKRAQEKAETKRAEEEEARLEEEKRMAEKAAKEAEAEARRLEAMRAADPEAAARAEAEAKAKAEAEAAAAAKAEAEAKLASLPKRPKGGAVGLFLGATSKTYFGIDACTKESPYVMVPADKMVGEIKEKGKISDLYVIKDKIEAYKGPDPKEILVCLDKGEVYGDNGYVICLTEEDKENFVVHLACGNPIPPEIK